MEPEGGQQKVTKRKKVAGQKKPAGQKQKPPPQSKRSQRPILPEPEHSPDKAFPEMLKVSDLGPQAKTLFQATALARKLYIINAAGLLHGLQVHQIEFEIQRVDLRLHMLGLMTEEGQRSAVDCFPRYYRAPNKRARILGGPLSSITKIQMILTPY